MRLIYKMSPRRNSGRFAAPKHERRGVCQIAPEQPLVGADHGNPEVIAGSVPRNASAVSDAPRSTPEVYLSLTTGRVRYSCLKEATPVRKRLCSFNGVAVMKKTRGIGDAANRSASGLGSIVVCERKLEARSLVGGQRKRTKPVGVGRHQGARSEWECHAATPASRGGERSWSWAAESLSRTTMGPPHLGQRQRGRGSLAADVCCSTCGCGIVPSS